MQSERFPGVVTAQCSSDLEKNSAVEVQPSCDN